MRVAPQTLNTTVAGLFVTGSGLFVLGSVPAYIHATGALADSVTYAAGSVFFTAAAFGQLVQAQGTGSGWQWHWRPHDRGWMAAVTQFPGTICFNVSTFAALVHNATVAEKDHHVWRPDIYGSVLFLVSSAYGVRAVGRVRDRQPGSAAWWAAWLNLVGSVAFMVSAIASYVLPSTGDLIDVPVAVGGTLVGAACFLVGAALIPLAWRQDAAASSSPPLSKADS